MAWFTSNRAPTQNKNKWQRLNSLHWIHVLMKNQLKLNDTSHNHERRQLLTCFFTKNSAPNNFWIRQSTRSRSYEATLVQTRRTPCRWSYIRYRSTTGFISSVLMIKEIGVNGDSKSWPISTDMVLKEETLAGHEIRTCEWLSYYC